jgi:hypothetical protein
MDSGDIVRGYYLGVLLHLHVPLVKFITHVFIAHATCAIEEDVGGFEP